MADLTRIAATGDIPVGEMIVVGVGGEEVAGANVGGEFFAFPNSCTNRGGPLGEGILTGDVVECPWHGGQFNVRTGARVSGPPPEPLRTYRVQVEGGEISVALD